jgi:hypothetical protein
MINQIIKILVIGGIIFANSLVLNAQNENSRLSVGTVYSMSRIISTMSAQNFTPYYNTWGTTHSLGLKGVYRVSPEVKLFAQLKKGELINSYDIDELDPFFLHEDRKRNKTLDHFKWKNYTFEIGAYYKVIDKQLSLSIGGSVDLNWGQLYAENFPYPYSFTSPELTQEAYYQGGKTALVSYRFQQISVVEPGLSLITSLNSTYKLTDRFSLGLDISWLSGITPMVGSKLEYELRAKDPQDNISVARGEFFSSSNNTGFRSSLSLLYSLDLKKKQTANTK